MYIKIILLFVLGLFFNSCRTSMISEEKQKMEVVIKDSLIWKKSYSDSLIKIPSSVLYVEIPSSFKEGNKIQEKKGQATVSIEKQDSTLIVIAGCDSLEFQIKILNEELIRISEENSELKQEIETKKNIQSITEFIWDCLRFGFIIFLISLVFVEVKKNK